MIVCSCNRLSDRAIRGLLDDGAGCARMSEVFGGLGCRAQCGRCAPTIRQILRESAERDCDVCAAVVDDIAAHRPDRTRAGAPSPAAEPMFALAAE